MAAVVVLCGTDGQSRRDGLRSFHIQEAKCLMTAQSQVKT